MHTFSSNYITAESSRQGRAHPERALSDVVLAAMYMCSAAPPSSSRLAAAVAFVVVSLALQLLLRHFGAATTTTVHRAAAQELDDEEDFSYRRDAGNGPARWGLIRREWATCSVGIQQSPIGLSDTVAGLADRPGRLGRSYRPAAASIVNRGHDIMVRFHSNPGGVVIDGVAYRLRQMHWHAPSEHAINGRRYAMELHMLHQSETNNRYAVVSQLYRLSRRRRDRTIHRLERYIRRIGRRKDQEELIDEVVDPRWPVSRSTAYYKYTGSFTTPPCTEGVTWVVAHQTRRVTRRQVRLLRNAVNDGSRNNARPIQEANGRAPTFYYTSPAHGRGANGD